MSIKPRLSLRGWMHSIGVAATLLWLAGCAAPPTPTQLNAVAGDRRVVLSWQGSEEASSYNVYWSTVQGVGTEGILINVPASPYAHELIPNGQAYYYVVTAVTDWGESAPTAEVHATPLDTPLTSLTFADPALADCVAAQPFDYIHELLRLSCVGLMIADLGGIEALYNLETVRLGDNAIAALSPLAELQHLKELDLEGNVISDLTPLAELYGLEILRLSNNAIVSVEPLRDLTNLATLTLNNNLIVDVYPLALRSWPLDLWLEDNRIGGQDVGNVDALITFAADGIHLAGNPSMSCIELQSLIDIQGSPPVDLDRMLDTSDVAQDGVNCTAP